ncbi:pyrokinin-1 receptor-like [Macrosteles quadrilineatus]|uniref:pyrokinin-1 receptor-like n=1 Tax=Macrosteles quadrilineatus TaxID=74068 RepID=UPI0023E14DBF|nr:pyrokinin-1 receptor-like [Macrosteles quadrilineatus]
MAEVPIAVFLLENSTNITTSLPSHSATGRESTEGGGTQNLWGPKRDPLWVVVPVTVYYVIIFISGVVGNVSTCVVIARSKHMHTATNYYLFSLAISDLLLLLSGLPPEMYHIWSNYPYVFGETFCVLTGFASETSTNATVLTITAFTVERYVAICHPFLSHTVSKLSRAVKFIMAIWIFSMILAVPQAIQMGLVYLRDEDGHIVSEEYTSCTIKHSIIPYSFFISTVLFFLTPMTLITVLYVLIGVRLHSSNQITHDSSQRRRRTLVVDKETHVIVRGSQRNGQHSKSTKRVVKMLVAVVVAFFICWAPFQVQRLYAIYGFVGEDTTATEILVYKIMSIMTYASGLLYYLSTTINPILYNIMSLKFRQAFKSSLTKCLGRDRLRRSGELASSGGGGGGSLGAEEITKIGVKMHSITMKWKSPKKIKETVL